MDSLAYEILKENKILTKRLFVICIIEFFIIVGMIIGFFIYESQYEYATTEEYTQETYENDSSNITQNIN
jgi:capsular polysaccharide biosynthesis protein